MNPVQAEMLDIAVVGGETLLNLINNLLDVDKMEQETVPLAKTTLAAETLIELACVQVSLLADSNSLTLVRDIGSSLPPLCADEDKLKTDLGELDRQRHQVHPARRHNHDQRELCRRWPAVFRARYRGR